MADQREEQEGRRARRGVVRAVHPGVDISGAVVTETFITSHANSMPRNIHRT